MNEKELIKERFKAAISSAVKVISEQFDLEVKFGNNINKKNDILIFVDAKKKEINKRLKKRLNFNLKIAKKLKKIQLSVETKKQRSDFIIKNNFRNNSVKKNVKRILGKILLNARSYS